MIYFGHYPQFVTITNYNWLAILQNNYHKDFIIEALKKRIHQEQVTVYGLVIMPNHLHLIWQLHDGITKTVFQQDFLKFTARSISCFMRMNNDPQLSKLLVKKADRKYQVWKRNSLIFDIYSEKIFLQKLNYIHQNPVKEKWKLAQFLEDYHYSSARFYETGIDVLGILSHYKG